MQNISERGRKIIKREREAYQFVSEKIGACP